MKCRRCGQKSIEYKSGYCEDCYDTLRAEIVASKGKLQKIVVDSAAPDAEKEKILQRAEECRAELMKYKAQKVPFYKSDPDVDVEQIYRNLGVAAPARKKKKRSNVPIIALSAACCVLLFGYFLQARRADNRASDLNIALNRIDYLESANTDLQAQVDKYQKTATTKKTVTLGNGNFVSGTDFAAGTYDIEAISGCGNVYSDNAYDGGLNAMMATSSENTLGAYEQKYAGIQLPDGTTLTVDGVKIKLTLVEAY